MSIAEEAKKFHADKRGNCAMAVAYGYARGTGKTELESTDAAQTFRGFGGGKAPEGYCGALYTAKLMAGPCRCYRGLLQARCEELHQVQGNPSEWRYPLQPLRGTRRRSAGFFR